MTFGHIAGQEGITLLERTMGIPAERCLAAGIDVSKASWRLLVADFAGEIVLPGQTLIADEPGYADLRARLEDVARERAAGFLRVGIEAAGHYHEILAGRLLADGYDLVCHNPSAVKKARGEAGKARVKTDDLDAAAICSLTIRGHGRPPYLPADSVGELRVAYLGREALIQHRSELRNQIQSLLDLVWPGATAKDEDLGVAPILSDILCETGKALIRLGPDPRRIGSWSPSVLHRKLRQSGARPTKGKCRELVARARSALSPCGPVEARIELLQQFLHVYQELCHEIDLLEAKEAELLQKTRGRRLPEVAGLAVVSASAYVAFVGDPARFDGNPARIFRSAGCDPARGQSGPVDPDLPISREGSSWGRAALMKASSSLVTSNPVFRSYLARRKAEGKPPKVARMAAANKANRLLCRLMDTGEGYDLEKHRIDVDRAVRSEKGAPGSTGNPVGRVGRGRSTPQKRSTAGSSNKNDLGSTTSPGRLRRG